MRCVDLSAEKEVRPRGVTTVFRNSRRRAQLCTALMESMGCGASRHMRGSTGLSCRNPRRSNRRNASKIMTKTESISRRSVPMNTPGFPFPKSMLCGLSPKPAARTANGDHRDRPTHEHCGGDPPRSGNRTESAHNADGRMPEKAFPGRKGRIALPNGIFCATPRRRTSCFLRGRGAHGRVGCHDGPNAVCCAHAGN